MKNKGVVLVLLAAALILTLAPLSAADDHGWLLGTWELSYDPDHSPKDYLTFKENGVFVHTSHEGEYRDGTYAVTKDRVVIIQQFGDKVVSNSLAFDDKHDILYFTYKGHTSHYTKVK
jgi:hypothetical protein